MFAKARITKELELENINYSHELFEYPFLDMKIPHYIGIVPVVGRIPYLPDKESADRMYERYCDKVGRKVEGFVFNDNNIIEKYVRYKRGKYTEYFDRSDDK